MPSDENAPMLQDLHAAGITVPAEVIRIVRDTLGAFFAPINGTEPLAGALDHLDPVKCLRHAELLQSYGPLEGRRILEIGSGYGTGLAVLAKVHGADVTGIEPDGDGFAASLAASRLLLAANGIDPARVQAGVGEHLPFPDASFDLVYSFNVLEHVQDPEQVLREAVRVLRPGGLLFFEFPNHLSYFEGHYLVVQPPLLWRGLLPFWVRHVFHRDYPVERLSLGEEAFLRRLEAPFRFEMGRVANNIGGLVRGLQKLNAANWIGRLIVLLQGHFPIHLVLRRCQNAAPPVTGRLTPVR